MMLHLALLSRSREAAPIVSDANMRLQWHRLDIRRQRRRGLFVVNGFSNPTRIHEVEADLYKPPRRPAGTLFRP
jgi:hypothetical protein